MPNTVPESVHPAAPAWSAEYLQEFLWRIVPGRSMRSMDDEVIAEFFREHPEHWEKNLGAVYRGGRHALEWSSTLVYL